MQPVFSSAPSLNLLLSSLYTTLSSGMLHWSHVFESAATDTFDAFLKMVIIVSHRLQHSLYVFGAEVRSSTRIPYSQSSQRHMPRLVREWAQVGWTQLLQPPPFVISLFSVEREKTIQVDIIKMTKTRIRIFFHHAAIGIILTGRVDCCSNTGKWDRIFPWHRSKRTATQSRPAGT